MRLLFSTIPHVILLFLFPKIGFAQCDAHFAQPLSPRVANYEIKVTLDDAQKMLDATQVVQFTNRSPEPIFSLKFYLYFNAFKNTESTFLSGTAKIFNQDFTNRTAEEWGWIEVEKISRMGENLNLKTKYSAGEFGNNLDQTVLEVSLEQPILPNQTANFNLKWRAKIPKTIARAGYSQDFYLMCHWFPQLGVFEKNRAGKWGWNCHQFHRNTEFYADFGNYEVEITAASQFVMGASGCLVSEKNNQNGTTTRHFQVEDVIDFAWSISPKFMVQEDRWKDVQIRLLLPPEHANLGVRYRNALKFAFEYLEKHVGKYPYSSITVVDPPFYGLRSGLMEYPTLVTTGTFYGIPDNLRLPESLVVHEFTHQYFMQMLASNEKEEPWLDEGFVTYFEDRIIDAQFGDKQALVNIFGYKFDNKELTRLEYTTMKNPRELPPARPGWDFNDHNFKPLIYSKTATTLRTIEQLVGTAKMDDLIQTYFERWKFKHPRGTDFLAILKEKMAAEKDSIFGKNVVHLFEESIFGTSVLDYSIKIISNEWLPESQGVFQDDSTGVFSYKNGGGPTKLLSKVEIERKGDFIFPVEILITFEDGSTQTRSSSGSAGVEVFEFAENSKILSAQIDPQQKISLDVDLNNNSLTLKPSSISMWKYAAKAVFWVQNILQTISFLS